MKPNLEEAIHNAIPLSGKVVYAFQGKPYEEVRTREVEDGWVQLHELKEHYPYRIPRTPYAYVDLRNSKGETTRLNCQWDIVMAEDKEHFFLLYEENTVAKAFADKECCIEANGNKIQFTEGSPPSSI